MALLEERYMDIAKSMGFILKKDPNGNSLLKQPIEITHQFSNARIVFSKDRTEELLDFLNLCQFGTASKALEERVTKLEGTVFHQSKDQSTAGNEDSDLELAFKELQERAEMIGTKIIVGVKICVYFRGGPRFSPTDDEGKNYFTPSNALDHKRKHDSYGGLHYFFRKNEYDSLEKWLEHDEKIYAEAKEKCSTEKNNPAG